MRWLVIGSLGMLGQDMLKRLQDDPSVTSVSGLDRDDVDVTDTASVAAAVSDVDIVVNCAAFTAVDAAEEREADAFAVNAVGPANLARAARLAGARLVHISTDYVFGGDAEQPYAEDGAIAPRSAYGRTKAAGEWAVMAECPDHLIVRTAWLYGAHGSCFPKTIARVAAQRGSLTVVDDQVGQPTWTVDLADLIVRLVGAGAPSGTYHGTSSGQVSWCGFAQAVVAAAGMSSSIVSPVSSEEYGRSATRPAYSVLSHDALAEIGVTPIGPWQARWQLAATSVLGSSAGPTT